MSLAYSQSDKLCKPKINWWLTISSVLHGTKQTKEEYKFMLYCEWNLTTGKYWVQYL